MNSLTVGQILFLGQRARFTGKVNLVAARVDGQLDASGATFKKGLNMTGLTVAGRTYS